MSGFADFNITLPFASESLLQARASPLEFQAEATRYLSWMMAHRSADQRAILYEFSGLLSFPRGTRVITAIPCHAGETQPLATLLALKRQGVVKGHEVVLFLNAGPTDRPGALSDAIRKIRREPILKNLTILEHQFSKTPPFGEIRGLLLDAVAMGALRSGLEDPIVISTDADNLAFAPNYIKTARKIFDRNRSLDFLTGDVYWGLEHRREDASFPEFTRFPEILVSAEYYVNRLQGHARPRDMILFPGINTVKRLSSYCAIGGMDYSWKHSEDRQIGVRFQLLRRMVHCKDGDVGRFFAFHKKMFVVSDPRRWFVFSDTEPHKYSVMDVTRNKGSKIDLYIEERRYLSCADRIQQHHIRKAIAGDVKALAHIRKRIKHLLKWLGRMDQSISGRPELLRVTRKIGIPLDRPIEARDVARIFHVSSLGSGK